MFFHQHPYPPFIPHDADTLIVGTLPPPRFSTREIYPDDVDFCYGSKYGLLWPILERVYDVKLAYENTNQAIQQRMSLLQRNRIGICDMVESCQRLKIDASDLGMHEIELRNLIEVLNQNSTIDTILFMGGNSRNGPEYLFRKHLKSLGMKIQPIREKDPRIHELILHNRSIKCVSLISPSSAANRSIGSHSHYKKMKSLNKNYSTLDFRIEQYQQYFA